MTRDNSADAQEDTVAFLDKDQPDRASPVPNELVSKIKALRGVFAASHGAPAQPQSPPTGKKAEWGPPFVELPDGSFVPESIFEERKAKARARNTPYQRERRKRLNAEWEARRAEYLEKHPPFRLTFARRVREARPLWRWLALPGARQAQFRSREQRRKYLAARIVAEEHREVVGYAPDPAVFAARLAVLLGGPMSRHAGKNVLNGLAKLEAAGGPWPDGGDGAPSWMTGQ